MKKSKYNKKIIILVIGLLLIFSPIMFSLAKYVIEKTGVFNLNLKGIAFNSDGLVSSNIDYSDSKEVLLNPERGYYTHYSITLANPSTSLATSELLTKASNVKAEMATNDDTLALIGFYLTNYSDSDLSDELLASLDEFCDSFRQSGYKIIVRFAYFGDDTSQADPTDFNQILSHIEQLEPFFNTNKDVIHVVQLGFMGRWGEWHSSAYSEEGYRKQIIKKVLEVVPAQTQILLRRPLFYKEYFEDGYFDTKLGFTSDNKARVGIYDDGFLATPTDYGTFETEDREQELKWMDYLTRYTIFGGEAVYTDEYTGYHDVESAIYNMQKTHTNFLNRIYHPTIIDLWKNTNITSDIDETYTDIVAYDYFKNKLGYRFVLKNALTPSYSVKQGDYLHISFDINNVGFGNLINYRNVELIIEKDGKYYINKTTIDPRKWYSSETTTETLVFKLPSNIEVGDWNIYLRLPDYNTTLLNNENYYIKFANKDIWSIELNANYIGSFSIEENSNSTDKGFYQVNSINIESEDESTLNEIQRRIFIDGKKTTSIEWLDEEIVYSTDDDTVYVQNDDTYLYVYTTSDVSPTNVQIMFATAQATSATDYNYAIENSTLYQYSSGSFSSSISSVTYAKEDCVEYRILLSDLNITSVSDLKGMKIVYMGGETGWSLQKTFNFAFEIQKVTGMHVDGIITHDDEYTTSDIFYQQDTATIYTKIDGEFLYVYAYDSSLEGVDVYNSSLFIGSNDTSKTSTVDGYMIWREVSLIKCDMSGCNDTTSLADYTSDRAISNGVEFKIPISVIGISTIDDIRNLRIWYRNSSWEEVKDTVVVYEEKLYPDDIAGKTVAFAKKPSSWSSIYIYTYNDTENNTWPGVKMSQYIDGVNSDIYAYVFSDDMTSNYVIFNENGVNQTPASTFDIYLIENGQQKIWDGLGSTVSNWTYYDGSVSEDKNIYFKFQIPSGYNQTKACAHIYYDGGDLTGSWPGMELTLTDGYWQGSFDDSNNYSNLKVILNNCSNSTKFQTDALDIKPGITVEYVNNWKVLKD